MWPSSPLHGRSYLSYINPKRLKVTYSTTKRLGFKGFGHPKLLKGGASEFGAPYV